ncbi:MAG TPA: transporter, partial [Bryobacteraceae bacterium]|nr:transporter [Bryobacteraceae bacterium]
NKIDSVNLHDFPVFLVHADDGVDNAPKVCSANVTATTNLKGCAFVRDLISTANSIDLKVNQYTTYVTFGLTPHIDLSVVIPVENVRLNLVSRDQIILGTDGTFVTSNPNEDGPPHFDHLWKGCRNIKPATGVAGLDPKCLDHVFPDPTGIAQGGSKGANSTTGIGDVVARVKWNAWHGERAGIAAGVDVRLPTGDELNYLGSGTFGVKPFAIFSYRARVSPHALVGYEWNGNSVTAGDLSTGAKAKVPDDFAYSVGADAWITKWLTGSFDIVGQRIFSTSTTILTGQCCSGANIFGTQSLSVASQDFLAPCRGACTAAPDPNKVAHNNLQLSASARSYNITNASMGVKVRPLGKLSKLVVTANVLVRLDEGGLSYKPVPLVGVGYTF